MRVMRSGVQGKPDGRLISRLGFSVTGLLSCCSHAMRFQIQYMYCQLSIVTFMRYDGRSAFPFQRRRTVTLRVMRHIRRCNGSSIVYLRVPDEEDGRVLLDAIDYVSRSRV